jgi:hypothetical protein
MQEGPRQPQDKFVLRLPDGMRDEIAKAAKANGRSMNAEIVNRLQRSFDPEVEHLATMAKVLEKFSRDVAERAHDLEALEKRRREIEGRRRSK